MGYYSLPVILLYNDISDIIKLEHAPLKEIIPCINKTLSKYINDAKCHIDNREVEWSKIKKYTNPYEYIHTCIPNTKTSICKLKPISRSFYKMIEISNVMGILDTLPKDNCKTFHFAEGPGGFIEAIAYNRKNNNDRYLGMSLINDNNHSIPGWKKSKLFLETHPNVSIWSGFTKDGDMLKAVNLKQCFLQHSKSCDIVTGDGGFDFAIGYSHQEQLSLKLVFAQCAYAMACQKKGGHFVLKVYDLYTQASIDILYLLSCVYKEVYIYKPYTSRCANSEKYIICKDFQVTCSKQIVTSMFNILTSFVKDKHPSRFITIDIPYKFVCAVQEINAILGQGQLECIYSTITLMNNIFPSNLDHINKHHINKCITWCQKYKLPYNIF